jgi:hypothetical protein
MKHSSLWLSGAIVAVVILLSSSRPASATTYEIYDLGGANGTSLYGIDSTGAVVLYNGRCGFGSVSCFETYVDGSGVSGSKTAPGLTFDDGSPCGSALTGFVTSATACNGGLKAFGSPYDDNGLLAGLYVDTVSGLDYLHGGSVDTILMNSTGDIAWVDGLNEQIFEAVVVTDTSTEPLLFQSKSVDAQTPEPGSWLLVGTGLLWATAAIKRRANR